MRSQTASPLTRLVAVCEASPVLVSDWNAVLLGFAGTAGDETVA
ncbi:hypothetical protein [Mycobacterium leprae]|nr:hypothetical protein [Mycobacterium leprae]